MNIFDEYTENKLKQLGITYEKEDRFSHFMRFYKTGEIWPNLYLYIDYPNHYLMQRKDDHDFLEELYHQFETVEKKDLRKLIKGMHEQMGDLKQLLKDGGFEDEVKTMAKLHDVDLSFMYGENE